MSQNLGQLKMEAEGGKMIETDISTEIFLENIRHQP